MSFTLRCSDPVVIADETDTVGEVVGQWGRDRANLVRCRDRHAAAVEFYSQRDAALRASADNE